MTQVSGDERDESSEDVERDELRAARLGELFYPNVLDFVTDRLSHLVARPDPGAGRVWCSAWFQHPEALSRLDSVWRAWEFLRSDAALGISTWWLHHVDPHMRALMDPATGPFARCVDGHRRYEQLPTDEVPGEGLFLDQRKRWLQSNSPFDLS
jgi:hypothetical protein